MAKAKKTEEKIKESTEGTKVPSRAESIRDTINEKNKGKTRLILASESDTPFHVRRPTGITQIDIALAGGWPAATVCQLFGPPGTGKTYFANRTIAEVQKNYGAAAKVACLSFGYQWDLEFARQICGVSLPHSEAEVSRYAELIRDIEGRSITDEEIANLKSGIGEIYFIQVEDLEHPAEAMMTAVLDIVKTAEFQLIIIDETNMAETQHGAGRTLEEADKVADQAGLLTRFFKKYFNAINQRSASGKPNETTILEILEVRSKISALSKGGYSQGGGNAMKHAKAVDLHLSSWQDYKVGDKVLGKEIEWYIDKGKMGVPEGASGTVIFKHGYGVDTEMDLLNAAELHNLVEKSGAWYSMNGEKLGQGKEAVSRFLRSRPDITDTLRTKVFGASKIRPFLVRS